MTTLARAIAYATAFTAIVLVLVPALILRAAGTAVPATLGPAQLAGVAIVLAGGALALWCVVTFGTLGRGTPVPFDPPRELVVRGPYRYVRNPMVLGTGVLLAGVALFFGSWPLLGYALVFLLAIGLFIRLYEEPRLQRTFGQEYDDYCRSVRRWLPGRPRRPDTGA